MVKSKVKPGLKKQPARLKDERLTDMKLFWKSVDWAQWWEDWYMSIDKDGRFKYKKLIDFCNEKKKSPQQREFLFWYLSTKTPNWPDDDPMVERYSFVPNGPIGWWEKRETGGWFTDQSLKVLSQGIQNKVDALSAMREAGNKVTLKSYLGISKMTDKLHEFFNGSFDVQGMPFDLCVTRGEKYIDMAGKLLRLLHTAQDMYAEAHGINKNNPTYADQFAVLLTATSVAQSGLDAQKQTGANRVLNAMSEITLRKAAQFGIPIPDEIRDKVIEVQAVIEPPTKKNKPN